MYCVAFSFTSPTSASICSFMMLLAISFALSHDSGAICNASGLSLASLVSNSPTSYLWSHSESSNSHVSIIASVSATAAIPAICEPLLPLLNWYTNCIISSYFDVMLRSSVCINIPINAGPAQPQFIADCWCIIDASLSSSNGPPYISSTRVLTPVWLVSVDSGSSPVARATVLHVCIAWIPPDFAPLIFPVPLAII